MLLNCTAIGQIATVDYYSDTKLFKNFLWDVSDDKHDQPPQSRGIDNVLLFAYGGLDIGRNLIRC